MVLISFVLSLELYIYIYIYIYIAESWTEVEADIWAEAEHELGMRVYQPGVLIVD